VSTRSSHAGRTRGAATHVPYGATTSRARPPKLVCLPGLHGTSALMADFAAALGEDATVQLVDYPRDKVLDYAALADLVRPTLPVGKPFVLLGESFSGPVALRLAAGRPHGLRGVVLSTSFAANPRPGLAGFANLARTVPPHALPLGVFTFWLLGRWTTPKLRAAFAQVLAEVDGNVLSERLVACLQADVRELLPKIDVPLLYLRGTRDRLVPPTAGELVAQAVKATHLVDLDAPHCLLQAIPAQAGKVVREFLEVLTPK
jgi:pimeloyl-ACP methyl ester carboxylesterase